MTDALVFGRIVLAGVFMIAGVAKAANPEASRRAFISLGGSPSAARAATILLPTVEIGTAIALMLRSTAWFASGFAVALLALFTAVVVAQFGKEVRPACPCFGSSHPTPVGRSEVIRNLVLAALAGGIFVAGRTDVGPDVGSWLLAASPAWRLGAITLGAGIGVATWIATRRDRAIPADREDGVRDEPSVAAGAEYPDAASGRPVLDPPLLDGGLPVGSPTPFWIRDAASQHPAATRPVLLIFVDERFPPGRAMVEAAVGWERELAGTVEIVRVSSRGERAAGGADAELTHRFRIRWSPAGLLLDERGRVATTVRHGAAAVQRLVEAIREASRGGCFDRERFLAVQNGSLARDGAARIGATAPVVHLPDASGKRRNLHDLLDRETALLFWHPECAYCRDIVPDLRRYETRATATSPRLLFVTAGPTPAARTAQAAFGSLSLFDPQLAVAARFGSRGTPSAVLLDERGRIDSAVAAGRDDVLALLGISRDGEAPGP